MEEYKAADWAALMLGGDADKVGLLHYDLVSRLKDLDRYCAAAGCNRTADSKGAAVASVIVSWQIAHPEEDPIDLLG